MRCNKHCSRLTRLSRRSLVHRAALHLKIWWLQNTARCSRCDTLCAVPAAACCAVRPPHRTLMLERKLRTWCGEPLGTKTPSQQYCRFARGSPIRPGSLRSLIAEAGSRRGERCIPLQLDDDTALGGTGGASGYGDAQQPNFSSTVLLRDGETGQGHSCSRTDTPGPRPAPPHLLKVPGVHMVLLSQHLAVGLSQHEALQGKM
jgi:hypothetical protein